jgi:hypothetical protein
MCQNSNDFCFENNTFANCSQQSRKEFRRTGGHKGPLLQLLLNERFQ